MGCVEIIVRLAYARAFGDAWNCWRLLLAFGCAFGETRFAWVWSSSCEHALARGGIVPSVELKAADATRDSLDRNVHASVRSPEIERLVKRHTERERYAQQQK